MKEIRGASIFEHKLHNYRYFYIYYYYYYCFYYLLLLKLFFKVLFYSRISKLSEIFLDRSFKIFCIEFSLLMMILYDLRNCLAHSNDKICSCL